MKAHPTSVHLLVVVEDWTTPNGKYREGHTSSYLARLQNPETQDHFMTGTLGPLFLLTLEVSVAPSVMKLPPTHKQPVIMAGLGTGMAPFRAFIQERAYFKSLGEEVGPMALYFGSRHRAKEYLYGEELEAYSASGLLTNLRLAFSRDQVEKVYIQHKIKADSDDLAKWMLDDKGHFYLCGPTWPAGDVYDAIVGAFTQNNSCKNLTLEEAQKELQDMKDKGRYVLEVY
jgi:sulfite reductase (NADPH) flavoprotein alpha-component